MSSTRRKPANREELRAIQEERFQRQMDLVFQAHPYYRDVIREKGLSRSDFKSLGDLRKLPLTSKEEYMAQPEAFCLQTKDIPSLAREERTLWDIVYTAGSTHDPTPFFDTCYDHYARISQLKRTTELMGIGADDTVINLFPLSSVPHQGFLSALWGSQSVGARMISGFGGSYDADFGVLRRSSEAVDMIERHGATVLWGIGFFLRRLVIQAQKEKRDFSSVRLLLPMGEASTVGMREDLRRRMADMGARDVRVLNGYGFTEKHGPSPECTELGGFHVPKPARFFFEFLDPETHEPVPEGDAGLVVLTHLDRRGTCLLRYIVGDLCSMTYEVCPHCGSWEPRFDRIPSRTGGIVKVKGTLVNVAALFEVMSRIGGIEEYEINVTQTDPEDPYSEDVLVVRIACGKEDYGSIAEEVAGAVRGSQEVSPVLEWVPPDHYSETLGSYKFKRFRDLRERQDR